VDTLAVLAAELPSVERALEAVSLDDAAGRQVGSHVRTVGVDDVRTAVLGAKYSEILAWNYGQTQPMQSAI